MKWLIFAGLKIAEISAVAFLLFGCWPGGMVQRLEAPAWMHIFAWITIVVWIIAFTPDTIRANIRWSEKIVERLKKQLNKRRKK